MKRELGIARCGLACCLCSENVKCSGCGSSECPDDDFDDTERKKGEIILKLDDETSTAIMVAEEGKRYHLITKFVKADGEYTLYWDMK